MVRETYREDLGKLLDLVPKLGKEVAEAIKKGLQAIRDHDQDLASEIARNDDAIDDMALAIERECRELLALQQPVAGDLRMILSVFKIATDLERVADLAQNLGEYAVVSDAFVLVSKEELLELGQTACSMVENAMDAFRDQNVERAKEIIDSDKILDKQCWDLRTKVLTSLITMAGQSNPSDRAEEIASNTITILWSIRDLERIGDHSGNICARLIYWLTADTQYI